MKGCGRRVGEPDGARTLRTAYSVDINRFTAMLASRLEAEGADRESAIRHSSAFIKSLPPDEAEKIASLCERNDEALMRIVSSLKKRIDMQPRRTADDQAEKTRMIQRPPQQSPQQPAQAQQQQQRQQPQQSSQPRQQQRQPQQVQRPANAQAQPIERVRRVPAHILDEDDEDDMINEMLSPGRRRADDVRRSAQSRVNANANANANANPSANANVNRQVVPRPHQDQQRQISARPSQSVSSSSATHTGRRPAREREEQHTIYKPDPNADYQKFYIIFACTSPIWGFLLICVLGLFIFALAAMFIGIFALIGILFVGVAVGTVVALVGIIYGITQLFSYAPIGLYEIGLGVRVGGFVMLGGIIVYNVAVRLLPYLIRRELDLFTFTSHKCVELYYYVKGACADL